ncbi:fumarylacetoacetate hydrolase family protein [Solwaraspora sp. WMMA2065]|uniref:2-keto-4-pentenoate hydratase n=1 Tax=Solwaraspora sp. WMMA2065 TaxID=3015166 RepID=UPI00259B97B7|nr:fumarylacetoacetate hydrolase family protein [Solwaraspora sp. WMMA2065]WJK36167.1 4-oxalocrotonate decarboxylase [Solwaraspora sp. WMMA2065]
MTATSIDTADLAARLDDAAVTGTPIPQLADTHRVDVDAAYAVQQALLARRTDRGERLAGAKMGLTSQAKMVQVGVDEPILGQLTDTTQVPDGGSVDISGLIHPRVEPEIAFLLDRPPTPGTPFTDAVRAVAPALEVIDSRYANFTFSLPDVIADNTSAALFTVGPWQPVPDGLDNLGVLLDIDGHTVQTGSTAAILGDPRRALAAGVALADRHGPDLRAGWIFLAGAATAAVPLAPGVHVRATVQGLGTAAFTTTGGTPLTTTGGTR